MSDFQIYALVLSLIVFTILTAVAVVVIAYIFKLNVRLVRVGAEDERITTEYKKALKPKGVFGKTLSVMDRVFSVIFLFVVGAIFVFSVAVKAKEGDLTTAVSLHVVQSDSMSAKFKKNAYLFENDLNDQIQIFDVIVTHKLPAEDELKLYDVVVYEVDGILLVHRIVGIEEPNSEHAEQRYFLLRGDNNELADRFPVRYEQMKGIYKGERMPYIGSFILFMQSPVGYLCLLLVIFATAVTPLIENKYKKVKTERLIEIGVIQPDDLTEE
ncbi:MAG: hypothetical protein IKM04_07730 [Clostridia bacterium]|nr:hypothetical protein [Clostridia bacterium]